MHIIRRAGPVRRASASRAGRRQLAVLVVSVPALAASLIVSVPGPAGAAARPAAAAAASARIDPAPIVTIDTQARVGSDAGVLITRPDGKPVFYPAAGAAWLQVVVLNRSTLDLVSSKSYPCPAAQADPTDRGSLQCARDLAPALAGYDARDLVIAASPELPDGAKGDGAPIGPQSAAAALKSIGVAAWSFWSATNPPIRQGLFAAVGVPGSAAGSAAEQVGAAPDSASGSARLTGYLLRDNRGLYDFFSPASFSFVTQAKSSGPGQNVMTIGGHDYPVAIPAGVNGGFQVTAVRQRFTNEMSTPAVTTRWFSTGTNNPPQSYDQVLAMSRYLEGLNAANGSDPQFVLISSRGNPKVALPSGDNQSFSLDVYKAILTLVSNIASVGGTRNGAYGVLQGDTAGRTYTLAGQTGSSTAKGYQLLGVTTAALAPNSAVAAGTLTRNGPFLGLAYGTEEPAADQDNAAALVEHTVFSEPGNWPEHGNAGRTAAIKWFGEKVYDTPEPRTQYWTVPYGLGYWNGKRRDIQDQADPVPPARGRGDVDFTAADFDWAKTELSNEIDWLEAEHGYLATLAAPFAEGALDQWASLQAIAADVNTKVQTPPENKVLDSALAILDFGLEVGKELPEPAGEVFGVVGALYHVATELTTINAAGTENAAEDFQSTVGELGKNLAERLRASQDTLTGQFANIVAADYQRLKTVGECAAGHAAGCPEDPARWQFTQNDQRLANQALQYGAQSAFYSALLGARYKVYDLPLPPAYDFTAPDNFVGHDLDPFALVCIFKGDPAYYSTIGAVVHNSAFYITEHHVSVLGYTTGAGTIFDPYHMHWPDGSIMTRMFSPVDATGNVDSGGLGLDREAVMSLLPDHAALNFFPFSGNPARTSWEGNGASACVNVK
jgi:hypothetical protein